METGRKTPLTPTAFEPLAAGTAEGERVAGKPTSFWRDVWRKLRKNKSALASLGAIVAIILTTFVIGPLLSPYAPYAQDLTIQLQGPSAEHWFGTDSFGRDLFIRVWEGTKVSLYIAFLAAAIDLVIGVTYGTVSAIFGGWVDDVMQRIIEVMIGIPQLIVVVLAVVALGGSVTTIVIALTITGWVSMARLVRGRVMQLREQEYFLASRSLGAGRLRLSSKHLIPNSLGLIVVQLMLTVPNAIFIEAILSFIGLGIQPPEASLGVLINVGADNMRFNPYLLVFPAIVMALLMLSFTILADGLRDAFDPTMEESGLGSGLSEETASEGDEDRRGGN